MELNHLYICNEASGQTVLKVINDNCYSNLVIAVGVSYNGINETGS